MTSNSNLFLRIATLTVGGILMLSASGRALASSTLLPPPFDPQKMISINQLHYGQRGYALTVFRGSKIDPFGVEIVGVMPKVNNGHPLVLIRLTSGPAVGRKANIVEGMSGSPVYIDGKLAGAISYSFAFAREPIGLMTPISDMLDSLNPKLPQRPIISLTESAQANTAYTDMIPVSYQTLSSMLPAQDVPRPASGGVCEFEPLATPVMVSGMSQEGIDRLANVLAPLHLTPMAGAGSSSTESSANASPAALKAAVASLQPGSSIGVSLVQGDIDVSAIGTLTYRSGNKVVAFGHPFTGFGPMDAALTTASITEMFPSLQQSTKLGETGITIGHITEDRPFSVGGQLGIMPKMLPLSVTIDDETMHRVVHFSARVINHPLLTSALMAQVADQAILQTHGIPGDAVAYVQTDVDADVIGHIERKNMVFDALSVDQAATGDLQQILRSLTSNPFQTLAVHGVSLHVTIEPEHLTAQIDHVSAPKTKYEPGDVVPISVVLRPYHGDLVTVPVSLTIPESTPNGSVTVQVRGGTAAGGSSFSIGGITLFRPPTSTEPPAATVQQVIKQLLDTPVNNDVEAILQLPSNAVSVDGVKLNVLPPTMGDVMRAQNSTHLKYVKDEIKVREPQKWVISGQDSLTITVSRPDTLDTGTGHAPATPSASPDSPPASTGDLGTSDGDGSSQSASYDDSSDDQSAARGMSPVPATDGPQVRISVSATAMGHTETNTITEPMPTSLPSPAAATTTTASPSASAKSVVRKASIWLQNTSDQFLLGKLENAAVTNANDVRLAPALSKEASTGSPYIWSLVAAGNGVNYAGTGDDGVIYVIAGNKSTVFCKTGELEVTSLAYDAASKTLYAGTAPNGIVLAIDQTGTARKLGSIPDKYVTALSLSGSTLYVGSGGGIGKIYSISLIDGGTPKLVYATTDAHIISLATGPDGAVFAGSAPGGILYEIRPGGKVSALYDTPASEVTSIAIGPSGNDTASSASSSSSNYNVYCATAPQGALYAVNPTTGMAKALVPVLPAGFSSVAVDRHGTVWGTSTNGIYRVAPDADSVVTYAAGIDTKLFCLAVSPTDGSVYAGASSDGSLYSLDGGSSASPVVGTYVSQVRDAKLTARWGQISWMSGGASATGAISLQTRTGGVPKPDSSWSDWSAPYADSTGSQITSPVGRFLQYRATMTGNIGDVLSGNEPSLQQTSIYFLPQNQPPTVKLLAPAGADAVSGNFTVRWNGTDPDKDTLAYDVWYTSDNGSTWSVLKAPPAAQPTAPAAPAVTPPSSTSSKAPGKAPAKPAASTAIESPAQAIAAAAASVSQNPNIPDGVRSAILQQISTGTPPAEATAAATPPTSEQVMASTYNWDTHGLADGWYRIKVMASNAPSNGDDALTAKFVSAPFLVNNTPPTLVLDPVGAVPDKVPGAWVLHGTALSKLSLVVAVQYDVDDNKVWEAATPDNGMFDQRSESFVVRTSALKPGTHKITVEAFDSAGNTASSSVNVTVH